MKQNYRPVELVSPRNFPCIVHVCFCFYIFCYMLLSTNKQHHHVDGRQWLRLLACIPDRTWCHWLARLLYVRGRGIVSCQFIAFQSGTPVSRVKTSDLTNQERPANQFLHREGMIASQLYASTGILLYSRHYVLDPAETCSSC